jgi:RNA polymerase sigma-B factor
MGHKKKPVIPTVERQVLIVNSKWPLDKIRLVEENLNLVPFTVHRYCKKFLTCCELEELISVGNIGLVNAAKRYNVAHSKFATFAVRTIYGEIQRHVRDNCDILHCLRTIKELLYKINQLNLLDSPVSETAEKLGVDEFSVKQALDYYEKRIPKSLKEPYRKSSRRGEPTLIEDTIGAEIDYDFGIFVHQISECLSDFEKQVFKLRYLGDLQQDKIAAQLGSSQASVNRALMGMRGKIAERVSQLSIAQ